MATTTSQAITASRFSITVDGYEIASFSELQGIKTELKTTEFVESGDNGLVQMNIPATPVLASIVLKRAQTTDPQMWAWHEAARFGQMGAARKSCSLVMYDAANEPVARYHLENAWPSKIELGALRAGSGDVLSETVTIVCDHLQRAAL
jgi:phage tail-like protein